MCVCVCVCVSVCVRVCVCVRLCLLGSRARALGCNQQRRGTNSPRRCTGGLRRERIGMISALSPLLMKEGSIVRAEGQCGRCMELSRDHSSRPPLAAIQVTRTWCPRGSVGGGGRAQGVTADPELAERAWPATHQTSMQLLTNTDPQMRMLPLVPQPFSQDPVLKFLHDSSSSVEAQQRHDGARAVTWGFVPSSGV